MAPKWDRSGNRITGSLPWRFAVIHGVDPQGRPRLLAFEIPQLRPDGLPDAGRNMLPTAGSVVYIGTMTPPSFLHYHPDDLILRVSAADDARYAARQTPPSPKRVRMVHRNLYMLASEDQASVGKLDEALASFASMLANEDDPGLYGPESVVLNNCRRMLADVHTGLLGMAAARTQWQKGCVR